jgi:hypothetical protein
MARTTNKDIIDKLQEIEDTIKLDKFTTLSYFLLSIGVAIISIGFAINNYVIIVFGIISIFFGFESGLFYYSLKAKWELKRK